MSTDDKNHEYNLIIRERHLDLLGHVNHAEYLVLYEEARWDWITPAGLGLAYVQKTRLGPVIIELTIEYKSELRLLDEVKILSRARRLNSKISEITQSMWVGDQKCSQIVLKFGLMDLSLRKLVYPPPEWEVFFGTKSPL